MTAEEVDLDVRSIVVGYGRAPVVRSVSLEARSGSITAIVGPNGAGKSTLGKAIAGVARPMSGEILLRGRDVTTSAPEARARLGLGYVPQVSNVFPSLTVRENLEMGAYIVRPRERRRRIAAVLEQFEELAPHLHKAAKTLSGGQRALLATARGMTARPEVLLLDEPTAGLSPRWALDVWTHLGKARDLGVTVVVIDQNTRMALSRADWAYVLVGGETRIFGPGSVVLQDEEVVRLYVGDEQAGEEARTAALHDVARLAPARPGTSARET